MSNKGGEGRTIPHTNSDEDLSSVPENNTVEDSTDEINKFLPSSLTNRPSPAPAARNTNNNNAAVDDESSRYYFMSEPSVSTDGGSSRIRAPHRIPPGPNAFHSSYDHSDEEERHQHHQQQQHNRQQYPPQSPGNTSLSSWDSPGRNRVFFQFGPATADNTAARSTTTGARQKTFHTSPHDNPAPAQSVTVEHVNGKRTLKVQTSGGTNDSSRSSQEAETTTRANTTISHDDITPILPTLNHPTIDNNNDTRNNTSTEEQSHPNESIIMDFSDSEEEGQRLNHQSSAIRSQQTIFEQRGNLLLSTEESESENPSLDYNYYDGHNSSAADDERTKGETPEQQQRPPRVKTVISKPRHNRYNNNIQKWCTCR